MENKLPTPPSLPSGREVLVVEDELRIRNMLSAALKEMGFHATLVPSAEAAQRALTQRRFDILILDLNLPGANGIEFLRSVRKADNEIQVIILTGFGDLDAARVAIHLDVVEFLTKPCALGTLEMALDRAWRRRKGQIVNGQGVPPELQFPPEAASATGEEEDPGDNDAQDADGLEEIERRHILRVLKKHDGNRAATAAELGISLRKLYYRLGEYQKKGLLP